MVSGGTRELWTELVASRTPAGEAWYYARQENTFLASEEFTNARAC